MDWERFLEDYQVEWVSHGPNTKKGEVSIQCPWCGQDDPSQHLGISLTSENWGCHRDPRHRGHAPHVLVGAITGERSSRAKQIVKQYTVSDPDNLNAALAALEGQPDVYRPISKPLQWEPQFRDIKSKGSTAKFWNYLEGRGFKHVDDLIQFYGLSCSLMGHWKDRIIIPMYKEAELWAWTARAIAPTINAPRYLSTNEKIKSTIFNEDEIAKGGDILFLCEGPFDALKIDWYGHEQNVRATCAFGTSMSIEQICILNMMKPRYKKTVILFDPEAVGPAFLAHDWLIGMNVTIGSTPEGADDPGALSSKEVGNLIKAYR